VLSSCNIVPNSDFVLGKVGEMPESWSVGTPADYPYLLPEVGLVDGRGANALRLAGKGTDDCLGWAQAEFPIALGKTYRMRVVFRMSEEIDPNLNLLFCLFVDNHVNNNHAIFQFRRLEDGWVEGDDRFVVFGEGSANATLKLIFRYSAGGEVLVKSVSLEECEPVPRRMARIATTFGRGSVEDWSRAIDSAADDGADLVLLPETFLEIHNPEEIDGPSYSFMQGKSKERGVYVAGTFYLRDPENGRRYNTGMLFDRNGEMAGRYDKIHLHTPEAIDTGITPGSIAPVWETEFGKVGMIICYDGWFNDLTQLLALKGAEIVLWPAAGGFKGLSHARAADNGIVFAASMLNSGCWIYDSTGDDVANPEMYESYVTGEKAYSDVRQWECGEIKLLAASFDLNRLVPPANYGEIYASPNGYRNRYEAKEPLYEEINDEAKRWWNTRPSRGVYAR